MIIYETKTRKENLLKAAISFQVFITYPSLFSPLYFPFIASKIVKNKPTTK